MKKLKKNKTRFPIGILPFRTRWQIAKLFFAYGFQVLLGDAWTENIADAKEITVKHKLTVESKKEKK